MIEWLTTKRLAKSPGNHILLSRADLLNEPSPLPTVGLCGAEGLPPGSALLVVKRGPNAGTRFLLDQPVRRHADIPAATFSSTKSP